MPLFWPEVIRCCSCTLPQLPWLLQWVRALHLPARKTLRCCVHLKFGGLLARGR